MVIDLPDVCRHCHRKGAKSKQIAAHPSNLRVSACKWGYQRILLFTQVCPKQGTAQSKGLLYHYFHLCHSVRRSRSFICARPYTRKVGYVLLESGGFPPIDRFLPVTQSLTQQDTVSKSGWLKRSSQWLMRLGLKCTAWLPVWISCGLRCHMCVPMLETIAKPHWNTIIIQEQAWQQGDRHCCG